MKKALIAAVLTLLAAAPGWAQGAKPDFSGTWNIDLAKSDFGEMPPPDSIVHVIEHKDPNLKISTTMKGPQGDTSNLRNLTTDGKDNVNKLKTPAGEQDVTSTSKWDGSKLVSAFKMDAQGMTIDISDIWELSEDRKVLTGTRTIKTPQGDFTQKTVYNKQ